MSVIFVRFKSNLCYIAIKIINTIVSSAHSINYHQNMCDQLDLLLFVYKNIFVHQPKKIIIDVLMVNSNYFAMCVGIAANRLVQLPWIY